MPHAPTFDVGRYWGEIIRQRLGETSTGKPQLVLSFRVMGKVNLADPEGDLLRAPEGERTIYRVISDGTLPYVIQDLDTLGWFGNSWAEFDEQHPKCCDIRGNQLAFYCQHKPRQVKDEASGEWRDTTELREEWSICQNNGPQVKPLDAKAVNKLDGMFGRALKSRQKPQNATSAPRQEQPKQPTRQAPKPAGAMTQNEINAELGEHAGEDIPF